MADVQRAARKELTVAQSFYKKFSYDWAPNLSGMLAYNLLVFGKQIEVLAQEVGKQAP